ncbi:MAG: hypothetical protein IJ213_06205 [Bacteroidales bacterium]|nr:hypothetical protein [Bacteroidales bacterium]
MNSSVNQITLPIWLDNYIYNELGGKYCKVNSDMTVIDWDKSNILNYLGTYFPRSYAEAIYIFNGLFNNRDIDFSDKEELNVFDFGCGTGGEIIGLLTVIVDKFENIRNVNISAFDGNHHSLRLFERVLENFKKVNNLKLSITPRIIPTKIDDFYDMSVLESVIDSNFDIIMTFKAICEFVTKQQFESKNPYKHFIDTFISKINKNGLLLIEDVTTKNTVSQEWLVEILDRAIMNYNIINRNSDYNQAIFVSHSKKENDVSKVAWRIIKQ